MDLEFRLKNIDKTRNYFIEEIEQNFKKVNAMDVLISRTLIDSNISYYKFVSVNNVLREYFNNSSNILISLQTIISYCLKCRKNKERKNPKVVRANKEKVMLSSKYEMCDSKKLRFIKE